MYKVDRGKEEKLVRVPVYLSENQHRRLIDAAERDGIKLSQYIRRLILREIGRDRIESVDRLINLIDGKV